MFLFVPFVYWRHLILLEENTHFLENAGISVGLYNGSRDITVGLLTSTVRDGRPRNGGAILGRAKIIISCQKRSYRLWGALEPPWVLSPGVKRSGSETDH